MSATKKPAIINNKPASNVYSELVNCTFSQMLLITLVCLVASM